MHRLRHRGRRRRGDAGWQRIISISRSVQSSDRNELDTELFPESDTHFFARESNTTVTFELRQDGSCCRYCTAPIRSSLEPCAPSVMTHIPTFAASTLPRRPAIHRQHHAGRSDVFFDSAAAPVHPDGRRYREPERDGAFCPCRCLLWWCCHPKAVRLLPASHGRSAPIPVIPGRLAVTRMQTFVQVWW